MFTRAKSILGCCWLPGMNWLRLGHLVGVWIVLWVCEVGWKREGFWFWEWEWDWDCDWEVEIIV